MRNDKINAGTMKYFCRKINSAFLVVLFVLSHISIAVNADGGVFGKSATVFYLKENSQYAVINYVNGVQKMIVSISFDWEESNKTAWVFPIPSEPEDVDIDIADGAPIFR